MTVWDFSIDGLNAAVLDAFGREVHYLPATGGDFTITAVFRQDHRPEEKAPGVFAVLFIREADLAARAALGDRVEVDGARYRVFQIERDGQGGALLGLHG